MSDHGEGNPAYGHRKVPQVHLRFREVDPRELSAESRAKIAKFLRHQADPKPRGISKRIGDRIVRVIANRIYLRPSTETFHEFLVDLLKLTMGGKWWDQQLGKKRDQHAVVRWAHSWCRLTASAIPAGHAKGSTYSVSPTGEPLALLTLADDIYRLSLKRWLPGQLVKRLKSRGKFQGARYEVATAAILARAGWTIDWINEGKQPGGCEFVATDDLGSQFALEAKSRHRSGVLHERGAPPSDWVPDIAGLLREARSKSTGGLPLVVFIDVNVPHDPLAGPDDKPWIIEARRRLVSGREPREALLVVTNFAWHLDGNELALKGEFVIDPGGASLLCREQPGLVASIRRQLERYGDAPTDE